jgi:TatD DNase family protein
MTFTDTHTHLYSEEFDDDRSQAIERAINAGVSRFFIPAIDSNYIQKSYQLEANFPKNIFLMAGLHPCYVKENYKSELQIIENQLAERKFYAIGEIGIDLYWDKTTIDIQKKAFRIQIQWAKKHKLPIIIHCREAFDEIFEVLETEKSEDLFGIFHCFSGNYQQALQAISYNMKLGIGGVVTFKNGKIDQFLHQIDIKNIVLETDSPYLAPNPYRGKRNESAHLVTIAQKISEIYNISIDEVARITTENSKIVFNI